MRGGVIILVRRVFVVWVVRKELGYFCKDSFFSEVGGELFY